jgi:hypothetical protein
LKKEDLQNQPHKIPINAPNIRERHKGKVAISNGWDGDDFVLHFSSLSPKINFKVNQKALLMRVIEIMRKVIPSDCKVDIWTPDIGWDLKMYTVKAWKLNSYWQINEERVEKMVMELFDELNKCF